MTGKGTFEVKLDIIGNNLAELVQTQKGMAAVRKEATELSHMFKIGLGIDFAGRATQAVAALPGIFDRVIRRGVDFNRRMYDAEIGIANVLAKFMSLDRVAAKGEAAKAMQKIIELEPKVAGGLDDLVQGFLATVASAQSAGIAVEQNIDLVGRFANAVANANLPASQLAQEMRAIFTGNITADAALAKVLVIGPQDVARAKEAGNLYEFLVDKIGSLGDAGDSAAVAVSSLGSAVDKLLGDITKPVFDAWLQGVRELGEGMSSPDLQASLRSLGIRVAELVELGFSFTEFARANADALVFLAHAAAGLGVVFSTLKLRDLILLVGDKTKAIIASRLAIEAETVAVSRNTAAQAANAALRKELSMRPQNFAAKTSFVGGLFAPASIATLVIGQQLISAIEASTLARLEAEERIARSQHAEAQSLIEQTRAASTLQQQAENRAAALAKIAEIDARIDNLRGQLSTAEPAAFAGQFQVGAGVVAMRNESVLRQIAELERQRVPFETVARVAGGSRGEELVSQNQEAERSNALLSEQEDLYKKATARAAELEDRVQALRREQALLATDNTGRIGILKDELDGIEATLAEQLKIAEELPDADKRALIVKDLHLQTEEKRIPLLLAIQALEKELREEGERAVEAAQKEADAEREKANAIREGLTALRLARLQAERQGVEGNPFLTTEQKRSALQDTYARENAELDDQISRLQIRLALGIEDGEYRLAIEEKLLDLQTQQADIQRELALGSFGGEFRAELVAWMDSFGSDAEQVAGILTGTVGASIDAISSQLTAAIFQTQSWSQAWGNIGLAVAQTFVQMVIRYAAARAAMWAINLAFKPAEKAATLESAATAGAAWAGPAVAASIATMGGADIVGLTAYIAALAAGEMATVAASGVTAAAAGGLIRGPGSGTSDSIPALLSNGEFVVRAAAVDRYGAAIFNAFNNLELGPRVVRPVSPGISQAFSPNALTATAGDRPDRPISVFVIPDEREATRIARHSQARGDIVRIVREERGQIFG